MEMTFWPNGVLIFGWLALYGLSIAIAVANFYDKDIRRGLRLLWRGLPFVVGIIPSIFTVHGLTREPLEIAEGSAFMLAITGVLVYATLRQWRHSSG
jgi:hypothetical protein